MLQVELLGALLRELLCKGRWGLTLFSMIGRCGGSRARESRQGHEKTLRKAQGALAINFFFATTVKPNSSARFVISSAYPF